MSDWLTVGNEQVVDVDGNWGYASDAPEAYEAPLTPPTINGKSHFHGLKRKNISNRYDVPVDHDACVASISPDTNYGGSATLGVRYDSSSSNYVYVYIKATGLSDFPSTHILDKGYLLIKRIYGVGTEQISRIEVRRVSGADWDESTITWNNKPAEGSEYFEIDLRGITQDTWISIDIKDWLQKWVDGDWNNYGLVLKTSFYDAIKRFHSSESAPAVHPFFSSFYFPYD